VLLPLLLPLLHLEQWWMGGMAASRLSRTPVNVCVRSISSSWNRFGTFVGGLVGGELSVGAASFC
jgi:hypothetical protein